MICGFDLNQYLVVFPADSETTVDDEIRMRFCRNFSLLRLLNGASKGTLPYPISEFACDRVSTEKSVSATFT